MEIALHDLKSDFTEGSFVDEKLTGNKTCFNEEPSFSDISSEVFIHLTKETTLASLQTNAFCFRTC